MERKAIVLLSGGADSATCLALAVRRERRSCLALSFAYGQKHACELAAAARCAAAFSAEHLVVELDRRLFSSSALTGGGPVPRERTPAEIGADIPATYVPARNLVFLSLAAALAENRGVDSIHLGVNARDYSGYPDCRPAFIEAFRAALAAGTRGGDRGEPVAIETPLIGLTKAEIFRLGTELELDYALTVSCYDPDEEGRACGACDSCRLRRKGFREAGLPDPTRYQA